MRKKVCFEIITNFANLFLKVLTLFSRILSPVHINDTAKGQGELSEINACSDVEGWQMYSDD